MREAHKVYLSVISSGSERVNDKKRTSVWVISSEEKQNRDTAGLSPREIAAGMWS